MRMIFRLLTPRHEKIAVLFFLVLAWSAVMAATALVFLAALRSPAAVFFSVLAGSLVRWLGQQSNLSRLRQSDKPAALATFHLVDQDIVCEVDDRKLLRLTTAWKWRIFAAATACCTCWAVQHAASPAFGLSQGWASTGHPLFLLIHDLAAALPLFCSLLFLETKGPARFWASQARTVIQERAARSSSLLRRQEMDGLGAGVDAFWQTLGIERRGEYRAAADRYLRSNVANAVLHPEKTLSMLAVFTELARQDLSELSAFLTGYRAVEADVKAAQMLAGAVRTPGYTVQPDDPDAALASLRSLAAERRWRELRTQGAQLRHQIADLYAEVRLHPSSVPPVVLAPGTDPYRVLGVSPDTPTPVIRKLRLSLAQIYHPDMNQSFRSSSKMAELNAAYDAVMKGREKAGR